MTTTSFKLYQVQVFENKEGYQNVIGLVRWAVEFQRGALVSRAGAETLLNTSIIQNFVPIEQLTKEQVLWWAFEAQGGQAFIDTISGYHEQDLDQQEQRVGLVDYAGFPVDASLTSTPQNTIPQAVL